eukprot:gene61211-83725_t
MVSLPLLELLLIILLVLHWPLLLLLPLLAVHLHLFVTANLPQFYLLKARLMLILMVRSENKHKPSLQQVEGSAYAYSY